MDRSQIPLLKTLLLYHLLQSPITCGKNWITCGISPWFLSIIIYPNDIGWLSLDNDAWCQSHVHSDSNLVFGYDFKRCWCNDLWLYNTSSHESVRWFQTFPISQMNDAVNQCVSCVDVLESLFRRSRPSFPGPPVFLISGCWCVYTSLTCGADVISCFVCVPYVLP